MKAWGSGVSDWDVAGGGEKLVLVCVHARVRGSPFFARMGRSERCGLF